MQELETELGDTVQTHEQEQRRLLGSITDLEAQVAEAYASLKESNADRAAMQERIRQLEEHSQTKHRLLEEHLASEHNSASGYAKRVQEHVAWADELNQRLIDISGAK